MSFEKPPRYRSYILTVWEERYYDPDTPVEWRFSLEDPRTSQRRSFTKLADLLSLLQEIMTDIAQYESH